MVAREERACLEEYSREVIKENKHKRMRLYQLNNSGRSDYVIR